LPCGDRDHEVDLVDDPEIQALVEAETRELLSLSGIETMDADQVIKTPPRTSQHRSSCCSARRSGTTASKASSSIRGREVT
jgi:hypothetical protein